MTNASTELSHIKRHVRNCLLERMHELDISASELARLIGSPRSTISSILSDDNNRLPHLYTLILVSRALSLPIENFLPKNMLYIGTNSMSGAGSFIHPNNLDVENFLGLISKYKFGPKTYYHPRSIPEFCKTSHMLSTEYRITPERADIYRSNLQNFFTTELSGLILLDKNILISLLDRADYFDGIPRHDTIEAITNLSNFQEIQKGRVSIYVGDRSVWRIDPVLVVSESVAVSDFFGSLLVHTDKNLIGHMVERIEAARKKAQPLTSWLSSV